MASHSADVVVIGANGFVGARICAALAERGRAVRAVVRRAGTAPQLPGIAESVGDFTDPGFAAAVVSGASALISTVHPMGSDRATQHRIGVEGTRGLAEAAAAAEVGRLIHISTAAVYDRSPGVGDVAEDSALVGDDAGDYGVTKRDADLALAGVDGLTRVILRPPAILGPGPTSTWNTLRPEAIATDESARQAIADQTFAWVHVDDLATLAADLAAGRVADAGDPALGPAVANAGDPALGPAVANADDPALGPVPAGCTALNVVAGCGTLGDYYGAVCSALGVEPLWQDAPAWTGRLLSDRAHAWGWAPTVNLADALKEIVAGLASPR